MWNHSITEVKKKENEQQQLQQTRMSFVCCLVFIIEKSKRLSESFDRNFHTYIHTYIYRIKKRDARKKKKNQRIEMN